MANKASSHGKILPAIEPPKDWALETVRLPIRGIQTLEYNDDLHDFGWRQWDAVNKEIERKLSPPTIETPEEILARQWAPTQPLPLLDNYV